MKFIVSSKKVGLTGPRKPCDEAKEEEITPLDYRMVSTFEEAKKKVWYKDWIEGGVNHREENGMVVCEKKQKNKEWVMVINTLEELLDLQNKYGEILIMDSSPYKEVKKELKILGDKKAS